jgi:hypothetical protein
LTEKIRRCKSDIYFMACQKIVAIKDRNVEINTQTGLRFTRHAKESANRLWPFRYFSVDPGNPIPHLL